MGSDDRQTVFDRRRREFDVICAGEAFLNVADPASPSGAHHSPRVQPGGGAINVSVALATEGLRVGLATVLPDDTAGRALRAKVAASGVDVGGVELARPTSSLVFVKGGARQVVSAREDEQPISVPDTWSSRVLLLSGMSPLVAHAAALCKAARAARRTGAIVVVGLSARWSLWQGRDPRVVRMVLREADVVWGGAEDLFSLNMDILTLRTTLRPGAVLVRGDGAGTAHATGPFGEVTRAIGPRLASAPLGEGEAFMVAICAELARSGHADHEGGALWARVLQRA